MSDGMTRETVVHLGTIAPLVHLRRGRHQLTSCANPLALRNLPAVPTSYSLTHASHIAQLDRLGCRVATATRNVPTTA
eukprot:7149152-Lingulodinium_polyedra.AAC.1